MQTSQGEIFIQALKQVMNIITPHPVLWGFNIPIEQHWRAVQTRWQDEIYRVVLLHSAFWLL